MAFHDDTIEVSRDAVLLTDLSTTDSFNNTATEHGLRVTLSGSGVPQWRNLAFDPVVSVERAASGSVAASHLADVAARKHVSAWRLYEARVDPSNKANPMAYRARRERLDVTTPQALMTYARGYQLANNLRFMDPLWR